MGDEAKKMEMKSWWKNNGKVRNYGEKCWKNDGDKKSQYIV